MRRYLGSFFVLVCIVLLSSAAPLVAQNFVYTNNNICGPNTVSAFSVGANGALAQIPGSPFATGGSGGCNGGYFAPNRAVVTPSGNRLYVSNDGDASISGFSINPSTGAVTLVPGSPFASGGWTLGLGLTVTTDSRFLYAANSESNLIYGFRIASNGSLTLLAGFPVPAGGDGANGIKISPNNKLLAVALLESKAVAMFSINPDGSLTAVSGSPFPQTGTGPGFIAGLDFDCAGNLLFGGESNRYETILDVYNVAANGGLTPSGGSPFTFSGDTVNSSVALFDPLGNLLFVSNQYSTTVTSFNVGPNGSLSMTPGSPAEVGEGYDPSGMALTQSGKFLYVANLNNTVAGFSVGSNGTLTAVPGTPFPTGQPGLLFSLAVYPPMGCFDRCIRDRTSSTFLLYNSSSGSYLFNSCPTGASLSGTGSIQSSNCGTTLSDSSSGRNIIANQNKCLNQVTAWVYLYSPWFRGFAMTNTLSGSPLSACACP